MKINFYDANIKTVAITNGNKLMFGCYEDEPIIIDSNKITLEAFPDKGSKFVRWVCTINGETCYFTLNPLALECNEDITIRAEGETVADDKDRIIWNTFEWDIPKPDDGPFKLTSAEWDRLQRYVARVLEGTNNGHEFIIMPTAPLGVFTTFNYNNVALALRGVKGHGNEIILVEPNKPYTGKILNDLSNLLNAIIKDGLLRE